MSDKIRLLVVEDSPDDYFYLTRSIEKGGLSILSKCVSSKSELEEMLTKEVWDIIISDYRMPGFGGLETISVTHKISPGLPVIIVSGTVSEEMAIEAMRAGAVDFVTKSNFSRLVPAIERELKDYTVRKSLKERDEQLQQAQKIEAIGRLAGGIAHDFNNILSIILMTSDALFESLPKTSKAAQKDLSTIVRAAERAAALTQQLLAFSRKQVLALKKIDLNEVVADVKKLLHRLIGEHISFEIRLGKNLSPCLLDAGQINQVLVNLVLNARDAMPSGGEISITTKNVTLDEAFVETTPWLKPGPYVSIDVTDNGSGMSQAVMAKIFDPFFTTKDVGKGTGLGLATAYGIVKQSGGSIFVFSEVGKGSTFKIYFPVCENEKGNPEEVPTVTDKVADLSGIKVLLVEDEVELRLALKKYLESCKLTVFEAQSPKDAISIILKNSVNLVIADVVMPEMSGPELFKELHKIRPEAKVLFISGYLADTINEPSLINNHSHYLAKPFKPEAFIAKVQSILNKS